MKFQGPKQIKMRPKWFFGGDAEPGQACRLPYGGAKITATVVWSSNGWYRAGYANATGLCRTADGQYFVAHEVKHDRLMDAGTTPAFTLPGEGYWLRVKRLSLRGALLFALQYCGASLRDDLLGALQAPADARSNTRRFADGSISVTVHFAPEPSRLLRSACAMNEREPVTEVYEAVGSCVRGLLAHGWDGDREMEAVFDDNAPGEDNESHPDTLTIAKLEREKDALLRELFDLQRRVNELETRAAGKLDKAKVGSPVNDERAAAINTAYRALKGDA